MKPIIHFAATVFSFSLGYKLGERTNVENRDKNLNFVRYVAMTTIFLIACPLSWYAAWDASGSILMTAFSVILPTWGLMLWGLVYFFGHGFGIGAGAFVLGMGGAFVSLGLIHALNPNK